MLDTDDDPTLHIESFVVINLGGVSTNLDLFQKARLKARLIMQFSAK